MFAILKRLSVAIAVLLMVVAIGTIGFVQLEGLSAFEALYFTVASITTVGYGDIVATTTAGRLLAMGLIVTGFTFFTATVVTAVQLLFEQREEKRQSEQLHTFTTLFFSEIGDKLIRLICQCDPDIQSIRQIARGRKVALDDFTELTEILKHRAFDIEPRRLNWEAARKLLNSGLLITMLENPNVFENAEFNELIRASFHLRDEMAAHPGLPEGSDALMSHIASDTRKVYQPAVKLWASHMRYMKKAYPALFYTMLKANPFGVGETENPIFNEKPGATGAG